MRDGFVVAAPCKINIHLRVLDRRSDGFHDLESVFQTISFGDELRVESLKERFACDILMDGPVPPERNIVFKAVAAFRRAVPFEGGVRIRIEKRVPFGAGLGGGSSDAASALIALNRISGADLDDAALQAIAAELGSDVPFFIRGGTAYVEGRGERVLPIPGRADYHLVLVNPGFASDTGRAFALLDAARASASIPGSAGLSPDFVRSSILENADRWPFFNDFLPVLLRESPAYRRMIDDFTAAGALFSSLSGSGATCFGVFSSRKDAETAQSRLSASWPFVKTAVPLARAGKAVLE
jgi:4-diphosphocytidyl-2-C-methyl-D-erythritol kinase